MNMPWLKVAPDGACLAISKISLINSLETDFSVNALQENLDFTASETYILINTPLAKQLGFSQFNFMLICNFWCWSYG